MTWDGIIGLGEMMNFPGVLAADPDVIQKLRMGSEKCVDGHAPGLSGRDLDTYIASGIHSEHESTTVREASEKLRKGMYVMMREGTATRNLNDLLPLMNPGNSRRVLFVSDDRHPQDLQKGHLNLLVRHAIRYGIQPIDAIRAVTLNPAECFGLKNLGAIAPGYEADIVVVDDLHRFNVRMVFQRGEQILNNGTYVARRHGSKIPLRSSVNVKWLERDDFTIPAKGKKARVIGLVPDQIITRKLLLEPKIRGNEVVSDVSRDILKLVVVERHLASGNIGKGLVKGFGLTSGAVASSVAHDSHNIICAGVDDESIYTAIVEVVKMGGGLAVAEGNDVLARLELPIAGLMSDRPLETVVRQLDELLAAAREIGSKVEDPFMALSFLALPVIPALKLTDRGLVDVDAFKIVPLFQR
jgi:adenine deaminase